MNRKFRFKKRIGSERERYSAVVLWNWRHWARNFCYEYHYSM